jgi:Flp pilus assembly protein TadG
LRRQLRRNCDAWLHHHCGELMRRLADRLRRDERGATSVEFAMLAAPLFLSILTVAQVGVQMQGQAALQGAAQKLATELAVSRFAPPPTVTSVRTRACELVAPGQACPSSLIVDLAPLPTVTAGPVNVTTSRVVLGAANGVLILRLQMDGAFAALGGSLIPRMRAAVLVRNA